MRTRSIVILLLVAACTTPLFAGGAECQRKAAEAAHRSWLGVDLNVDNAADTVTVARVAPNSPAERAGFRAGDRLVALNDVSYGRANEKQLASVMEGLKQGDTVTYTVWRD